MSAVVKGSDWSIASLAAFQNWTLTSVIEMLLLLRPHIVASNKMSLASTSSKSDTSGPSEHRAKIFDRNGDVSVSISRLIRSGLSSYEDLVSRLKENEQLGKPTWSVPADLWEDELGRLRVWAANIGAHQIDQSSLDFRLRDASHIRQQVIELLQDLRHTVEEAEGVTNNQGGVDVDHNVDDEASSEEDETESEQLYANVVSIISCLFQMSMLVRRPARHNFLTEEQPSDISAFEPFDINHVKDKYPRTPEGLAERLGQAMTQRRKQLKYRERHHAKLSQGLDAMSENHAQEKESILSETDATYFNPRAIDDEDDSSKSDYSQTSYASTLSSGGDITIPAPPKGAIGGQSFECPYCYFLITAKDTRSWHKHVFLDLQPYICTVSGCPTGHKLYSTQHDWARHLKISHPTEWGRAPQTVTKSPMTRARAQDLSATCPLCQSNFDSDKLLERDLARHLQELALFVLPRRGDDSDAEQSNGADESNSRDDDSRGSSDQKSGKETFVAKYRVRVR